MYNTEIELDYKDGYPPTINNINQSKTVLEASKMVVGDKAGSPYLSMGGEDFSQYGRTADKIPSVLFWVGAVEPSKYAKAKADGMPLPSLHSSLFAPDYARTIQTGSDAMTAAALELFKD